MPRTQTNFLNKNVKHAVSETFGHMDNAIGKVIVTVTASYSAVCLIFVLGK